MKKKIIFFLLVISLLFGMLSSCTPDDGNENTDGALVTGEYIFKRGSEVTLVSSSSEFEGVNSEKYNKLILDFDDALAESSAGIIVHRASDSSPRVKREIIVGKCDRELSRQAYRELEALNISGSDTGYVIYSNGSSVAIAYNEDDTYLTPEMAFEYFVEKYIDGKSACTMTKGVEYSAVFSLIPYYQERDDANVEKQWEALTVKIEDEMRKTMTLTDAKKFAEDIVGALKDFYTMYNDNMVSWLANLFEPAICICEGKCQNTQYCGGAGFYYSNSGRDTEGFLPDAESTAQALGILENTGMLGLVNGDVKTAFTEDQIAGLIRFCKGIQDPETGYFYHPQWSREEVGVARLSRDMGYACSVLSQLGSAPTYNAPNGVVGDGILYDGTDINEVVAPVSRLTGRLSKASAVAVTSVVESTAAVGYPYYMENDISYQAYLNTLDLKGNSYSVGNQIAASASQLIERQKQLSAQGVSYNLISITDNWFRKNQNTKTGTWDFKESGDNGYDPYYGNDGVLKISAWYNDVGRAFPNPALAAQNAINAILSEQDIEHVCNLYNTWFTISNLKINVRKYGSEAIADQFVNDLRMVAAEGIRKSREKIQDHRKDDGSFSYFQDHSSQTSQGMPVAVADTDEGDLNATCIATYGLVGYIFSALDFGDFKDHPDIYTDTDRREFLNIVTELEAVIKRGEIDPSVPHTFDNYGEGATVSKEEFSTANSNPASSDNTNGTSFTIIRDERPGAYGNVLKYHSASIVDSTDYISLMSTTGTGGNTWVFSIDLNLKEYIENECGQAGTHRSASPGDAIYINMGDGQPSGNVYMIVLRVREDEFGNQILGLWDASSDSKNATVDNHIIDLPMSEWFNLKVEYYRQKAENSESMRAKIYIDDKVVFVSDNYFDRQGLKITGTSSPNTVFNRVWISTVDRNTTTLLMDNFAVYKFRKNYVPEKLPIEKNVDGEGHDKKVYDFSGAALPEEIEAVDNVTVANGALELTDGKIVIPANIRSNKYNRASFEADIKVNGTVGNAGYILFVDNTFAQESIMQIGFRILTEGGKKYVQLYEMQNGVKGSDIEGARFETNKSVKLRIDFFNKEDKTLIYINGAFINQADGKFGEVNKLTYGATEFAINSGYTVVLDNIVTDHDTCDFTEAPGVKKENVPENQENFDSGAGLATLVGGATVENSAVKLDAKNEAVTLAPSVRSYIGQCNVLSADIVVGDITIDGDLVRLALKNAKGEILFAVDVVADGDYIKVYEVGIGGRYPLAIAKGLETEEFNIKIEYYNEQNAANIYINGLGVATTNISYNTSAVSQIYTCAEITSLSIYTTLIESMTADLLYRPFASVGIESDLNEENSGNIVTFDYALDKNMPKALTGVFKTYGAGVKIEQMLKKFAETQSYSKVVTHSMSAGGNDEFMFQSYDGKIDLERATSTVFESEICIDQTAYRGTLWQVIFGDSKKGLTQDAAYMLGISSRDDGVYVYEASSTNGANSRGGEYYKLAEYGEWFKLRIEHYKGDDDTVRIKVFTNDICLFVSDNYYRDYNKKGEPKNYFNRVNFYGQSRAYATIHFDNMGLYANDGATCTEDVTVTYTYGGAALPEFMR